MIILNTNNFVVFPIKYFAKSLQKEYFLSYYYNGNLKATYVQIFSFLNEHQTTRILFSLQHNDSVTTRLRFFDLPQM